jgi:hypothetical protein
MCGTVTVLLLESSPFSLSLNEGIALREGGYGAPFTLCHAKLGSVALLLVTGHACMISVTDWLSEPWCSGIGQAKMSSDGCPYCRLTSVMFTSVIPTGISLHAQN